MSTTILLTLIQVDLPRCHLSLVLSPYSNSQNFILLRAFSDEHEYPLYTQSA